MAHKNMVGSTAYDTKGGKCLVGGTGYAIKKGRTLVGGTGYDVNFIMQASVTITGSGQTARLYAVVAGTKYTAAKSGLVVSTGDVITFCVYSGTTKGSLIVDGETLLSPNTGSSATEYDWVVPGGVSSITIAFSGGGSLFGNGTVTVTTS